MEIRAPLPLILWGSALAYNSVGFRAAIIISMGFRAAIFYWVQSCYNSIGVMSATILLSSGLLKFRATNSIGFRSPILLWGSGLLKFHGAQSCHNPIGLG